MKSKLHVYFNLLVFLALAQLAAFTQMRYPPQPDQNIRARISGGGGGKCTFEVVIDGAANVQIRGDEGRLHWMGGGGMSWRRLDCNQPLPRNPNNFRFHGIDGRGSQTLLKSPNNNNGVAVIRVDDPQKGSEGYTGDITWDGGNDSGGRNGGERDRNGWNDGNRDQGDDWNSAGNWNPRVVSNCQNAIRDQLVKHNGDNLTFIETPNAQRAGSLVSVQGLATYRDRKGHAGDIRYNCNMYPNGNVLQAKYNPIGDYRLPRR
jgi:hypothetical protein